ncbi:DMT family transporter [Pasteurella multocida]|uniref:DMT family transporter n=1 Tax=Pasteurella multocida TaxID=747 RepID=UPI002B465046|nr:DMT family transporter [Pasteurella multocida]WRK07283.1 DMT family transporter [Pasteurella multocida]
MMKKGYILGLSSGFLWAISGIVYQILYNNFPNLDTLLFSIFILFFIEFISLVTISSYLYKNKKFPSINKNNYFAIFSGLLGAPIAMFCYLKAIQIIGVNYAAAISSTYPILAALLSIKINKENKENVILFTSLILITILLNIELESDISITGIFLAIFVYISWASEITLSSYAMHNKKNKAEDIYFIRQLFSVLGYIIVILYTILTTDNMKNIETIENIDYNNTYLVILVISLTISSGLSYFLYYKAIEILKPIRAMALNITYTAWSIILSHILIIDRIDIKSILTCFIIFTFVTILSKERIK